MILNLRTILISSFLLMVGIVDCFAQPATPGAITGITPVCQGVTNRTYSVVAVPTATSYTWTYTGTGATITAGSTTRSITVTYSATATSGDWTVTATNGGGTSGSSAPFSVVVNTTPARPAAFTISSGSVCQNQTGVAYAVAAVSGATSYTWAFTGTGASFSGSTNSETVDFSPTATSGNITVAATTGSCSSATRAVVVTVNSGAPATPGVITGVTPVCQGATGNVYSVVAVAGAASYSWTYTGTNANVTAGATTRSMTTTYSAAATSGDWTVTATNGCGTSASSPAYSVVVNTTPARPAAFTTSSASVCQNQTGVAYAVASVAGATSYNWTYSGTGATFSGITNSETVDFSGTATSGNISISAANGSCVSAVRSVAVTVNTGAPVTPGAITGVTPVCQGSTGNVYSVAAVAGASTYAWSYTGTGATITAGSTTRSITVTYTAAATSGDWSCTATNTCGTSASSPIYSVVVNTTPARPGVFTTSSTSVCQNQTGVAYAVASVAGATSYNWTYSGTGATFSGVTNSETVDFSGTATSGNISIASVNGTCVSAVRSVAVTVNTGAPSTPGSITGVTPVCQGTTGNIYSVSAVAGASSYTWSYTGSGATITAGSTTNSITVTYTAAATSGDWSCTATNPCGTSSSSPAYSVVINTTPSTPGAFTTSSTSVCQSQTGVAYIVTAVAGATSYNWSYSGTGATFSGTTNSETVDFSASATSGSISIAAVNGTCVSGLRTLAVTVNSGAPATPGVITGVTPVCQGATGNVYSVVAVAGAVSYTWSYTGTGASITAGSTTRSITVTYSATATSGDWSCTATNTCGTSSSSPAYSVVVNTTPARPGAFTTSSTSVCQSQTGVAYIVNAVAGASSYNWSYSGTGATFSGNTNSETVDFSASATSGSISIAAANGSCVSAVRSVAVTVTTGGPSAPGTITGVTPVCQTATGNIYSVTAVAGASSYTWSYTGTGATITAGSTTNSITVTYTASATSGDWSCTATNGCGTSSSSPTYSVVVNIQPARPGAFTTSSTSVCQGQNGVAYAVTAVAGATSYNWSYSGTGATFSGTTNSETVDFSVIATAGSISIAAANGTCVSAVRSVAVTVNSGAPATPGVITGASTLCRGTSGNAYSITPVAGATSYTWAIATINGVTIVNGTTASITANVNNTATASTRTLSVTANNGCGISAASTLPVTVLVNPVLAVTTPQTANQGSTLNVVAPAGAATYDWTGPGGFSSSSPSTTTLVTTNAQASNAGTYTLIATNANGCFRSYPVTVTINAVAAIFRSAATGDFSNLSTWESSSDSSTWNPAVAIPDATSSTVTIVSGDNVTMDVAATIKNIIIEGTLTADASSTLTVTGYFTNNGSFIHNNGIVEFAGDESYSISGSAISTDFYNLLINKTTNATITVGSVVTLKEKLSFGTSATNELYVDNGNGGSFTFLSDATSTAHIDVLTVPYPILTGDFNCQHYLPAQTGRYSFMLGVPVTNSFMSDLQPNTYDTNGFPVDGIYVSGPFTGSDTGNGLSSFASSSFAYNPSTGLYFAYPVNFSNVATTPLVVGSAYRHSVRDGGPSATYPTVVAKTLNVTGSLVTPGSFTFSGLVNAAGTKPFSSNNITGITTGGWNLIANPYMSDISIDLSDPLGWSNTNISNTSYVYDAAARDFLPCASGIGNCTVSSFQGFWVQATGSSPTLSINEEAKVTGTNNTNILRTSQLNTVKNYLPIKLSSSSVTNTTNTNIRYVSGASLGNDSFDGFKIGATNRSCLQGVNVCLYTKAVDGVFYSVNAKPYGLQSDTTNMHVIAPVGSNTLNFSDVTNLLPIYNIALIDKFTNTITDVSANPIYNFSVTSDTNSWGPRFRVVFTDIASTVTSIEESKIGTSSFVSVYPSPGTADKINVIATEVAEDDVEFSIYDLTGRLLFSSKINVNNKKAFQVFDLSRILHSGIYSAVLKLNNTSYSQKLIIR